MNVPKKKNELVIKNVHKSQKSITIDTSGLIIELLSALFGKTQKQGTGYYLAVDSRYDFDEVVKYIKELESMGGGDKV